MLKRVLVAVVCIPLLLVVFFLLPPMGTVILFALLSIIATYEALCSTKFVKSGLLSGASILLAGAVPFWVYFGHPVTPAVGVGLVYFVVVFAAAIASRHSVTTEQIGGSFFFAFFISFFLSSFIRLMGMPDGKCLILTPLIAAFLSDAFALFAGMLFGKHKLAPTLSPKKTIEGSVGGLFGAVVGMAAFGLVMQIALNFRVNYGLMVVYGVVGSVISQLGDLSFSYIKRQYHLKDFGTIFPGHGGVLDRFDSVIFCAPLIELLWRLMPAMVHG